MRPFFFSLLLLTLPIITRAQQILSGSDYIYKYQMSVGKTNASPTNITPSLTSPAAWIEIGRDSTNKAMLLPRAVDTALVLNPVKGLFLYQIKDSTLYYRNKHRWVKIGDDAVLEGYLKIADSTIYYPYASNPLGYISTEADPVANSKIVTLTQGTGIFIGGSAQFVGNNPSFSVAANNTTALWNANALQGIQVAAATPTTGQLLQFNGVSWLPQTVTTLGTVTSVGLALPGDVFNIAGSPVTTSGTLNATFKPQFANLFLASPNGISGLPSFRSFVNNDLPLSGVSPGTFGSDTSGLIVTVNSRGIMTNISNAPINFSRYIINQRDSIQTADMQISGRAVIGDSLAVGSTTPATANFQVTGSMKFDLPSSATGDLYYRNSSGEVTRLPIGASNQVLVPFGGVPIWGGLPGNSNSYIRNSTGLQTSAAAYIDGVFRSQGGMWCTKDGNGAFSQSFFLSNLANNRGWNFQLNGDADPGLDVYGTDNAGLYTRRFSILANGNVGIGDAAPAQKLAVTGNAIINGNIILAQNGTPCVGCVLTGTDGTGNSTWQPKTNTVTPLEDFLTDANNSSSGTYSQMYAYTIPASTLTADGDKIKATYGGQFASNGNTKGLQLFINGTGSGASDEAAHTGGWSTTVTFIRTGTTTGRFVTNFGTLGSREVDLTGLNFTTTITFELWGKGGGPGDVTAMQGDIIKYNAAP